MNEFLSQSKIDQLSEQELRVKYFEIFNALAAKNEDCAQMINTLDKIQNALNARK